MIATLGRSLILLSLLVATVGAMAGFATGRRPSPLGASLTRRAAYLFSALMAAANLLMVYALLVHDFSVSYVAQVGSRAVPTWVSIVSLWSSLEGSILFWGLVLGAYVAGATYFNRDRHPEYMPYAIAVWLACGVFFAFLLAGPAQPFQTVPNPPADGPGPNPLLQNHVLMAIHPPFLYLGYVGMTIPFGLASAALLLGQLGHDFLRPLRTWLMLPWIFQTVAIVLGGWWAYEVLGWGGYWAWDPVENASFLPWLTGTAFLHSVMMQEKRGMLKVWNVWLIFTTFLLSILGTFLTRSGIVSSVHAFAQSAIGTWFVVFMAITLAVCTTVFLRNRDHLRSENRLESLVSRESSFLFNNLLLLAACFSVLWGTLFPVISEWVQGTKVTVGPPFFNRVNIPIWLLLLLLTAVGPLLAWRKTSLESLKRNFTWPVLAALGTAALLMAFGMRPWQDASVFYSLMGISLAVLVTATVLSEFIRGGRVIRSHTGMSLAAAMVQLTRRNTRRYGGYIVHFGVVVIAVGLAGSAFNRDVEQELGFGDQMTIGAYTLVCRSYTQDDNPNYGNESAVLDVFKGGKLVTTMFPERRFYKSSQQASTMVAIRSTPQEDLYLVYAGKNPETDRPIIKAHLNPLVMWVWIGVAIVVFGTLVALVPNLPPAPAAPPSGGGSEAKRVAQASARKETEPVEVGD